MTSGRAIPQRRFKQVLNTATDVIASWPLVLATCALLRHVNVDEANMNGDHFTTVHYVIIMELDKANLMDGTYWPPFLVQGTVYVHCWSGAPPRVWDWGDGDSRGPARNKAQNPPTPKISFLLGFRPLYFGNIGKKSNIKR